MVLSLDNERMAMLRYCHDLNQREHRNIPLPPSWLLCSTMYIEVDHGAGHSHSYLPSFLCHQQIVSTVAGVVNTNHSHSFCSVIMFLLHSYER